MALVDGVNYSLSTKLCHQKSVIFVKLTDSALRAIEDYLRIQHKTGEQASVEFLGNEGRIRIPSQQTHDGSAAFDFSLSSNADIEGLQGSFECIQQSAPRSLESMGPFRYKMRIKANDDVYAETRQRIKAVEEERKQDCAKEIKPNGGGINRKVKTKMKGLIPSNGFPPRRAGLVNSGGDLSSSMSKMSVTTSQTSQAQHKSPSFLTGLNNNATLSSSVSPHSYSNHQHNNSSRFSATAVVAPNHGTGSHFNHSQNLKNNNTTHPPSKSSSSSDVSRKPLRERLIHLLALKPHKKPELMNRLHRDGLKEKDKRVLMQVLKQVSSYKDNEYNLLRGIWNDVQEDWPHYSPHEREIMKRRKPQNLTPVGSDCSVGSATSGTSSTSGGGSMSPRSTHSLSPSSSYSGSSGKYPVKRAPDDHSHPYSKKQRVSHYVRHKPPPLLNNNGHNSQPLVTTQVPTPQSSSYSLTSPPEVNMDCSSSPPPPACGYEDYSSVWSARDGPFLNKTAGDSDETDSVDSGNGSSSSSSSSSSSGSGGHRGNSAASSHHITTTNHSGSNSNNNVLAHAGNGKSYTTGNGASVASSMQPYFVPGVRSGEGRDSYGCNRVTSTTSYSTATNGSSGATDHVFNSNNNGNRSQHEYNCRSGTPQCSPDSQEGLRDEKNSCSSNNSSSNNNNKHGKDKGGFAGRNLQKVTDMDRESSYGEKGSSSKSPTYLSKYSRIESPEQRYQYKEDFNAEYSEYRYLHSVIDKVSKKFAHLEEKMRREERGSPEYQKVKNQIVDEYYANKRNKQYQESKEKFSYLHEKLSHIKRLVMDYDALHSIVEDPCDQTVSCY